MAKPKATDRQKVRAYKLWAILKFGPTAIHDALQEEFTGKGPRKPVSIDTVKKWIAEFKKLSTDLDQPFSWHRMDQYGIPWEASRVIMRIWKEVTTVMSPLIKLDEAHGKKHGPPTFRQVRWWWRVYRAVDPSLKDDRKKPTYLDWAIWGDNFAGRELDYELLGHEPYFDDLFAYLAFRPWASDEAKSDYLDAIKEHLVPGLFEKDPDFDLELINRLVAGEDLDVAPLLALDVIEMEKDDFPLLPSEWMAYTHEAEQYSIEMNKISDPMDKRLLHMMFRLKRMRLQGLSDEEIRRRIHEIAILEWWETDTASGNYVRYFPLNNDDVIEWVDRLIFHETHKDEEAQG